jgi:hypothetical protein
MNAPIPALSPLPALDAWTPSRGGFVLQIGEQLRLQVALAADGALLGRTERGQTFALPAGLAQPGEMLLVRVLASQPQLQLQIVERRAAEGAPQSAATSDAAPQDTGALRADPAWLMRRLPGARPLPGAASASTPPLTHTAPAAPDMLAAQWRGRVLAEVLKAPMQHAGVAANVVPEASQEAIRVQGWNGQPIQLRLLHPQQASWPPPGPEDEAPQEPQRDGQQPHQEPDEPGEGLRLGLILSLNGDWVQVVLQWQAGGVLLHLSAESPATLQQLRGLLPRVSAALAAVPLPLRHCQLSSRPPAMPPLPSAQQAPQLAHASSNALFRAAAEIAAVLQQA